MIGALKARPAGVESKRIMVKNVLPGRQSALTAALLAACMGGAAFADANTASQAARAESALPIAVDWRTGLAIHGVDPVAYFVEKRVVQGESAWELRYGGAVWRFCNEGNRAAFAAHPEIYMPRFGGNDPMALARGVVLAGNPRIWVTFAQRTYLFHTPEARDAFLADPQASIARAEAEAVHHAEMATP